MKIKWLGYSAFLVASDLRNGSFVRFPGKVAYLKGI